MADTKLSALTELATTPANDDEVYIRDISEPAADESKRITMANLISSLIAKALLTTRGDIIYRNATVPARLAKGSSGDVLTMGPDDPAWAAPAAGGTTAATGTYTGDGNDNRQITVGFKCSLVIIIKYISARDTYLLIPGASVKLRGGTASFTGGDNQLHASDGFEVDQLSGLTGSNENGITYKYWAISE